MTHKILSTAILTAAIGFSMTGLSAAKSMHGTVNSTIGSTGAHTRMNGKLHSRANRTLRTGRSVNGSANSSLGSSGAASGMNGALHSGVNARINKTK